METKKQFGVVGAGLVGSLFEDVPGFEVVHRNEWEPVRWEDGLVNCAGIAGRVRCKETDFAQVLSANVHLPMEMFEACQSLGVPFVAFSTTALYDKPEGDTVSESNPLYPHDSYSASKILMERMLPNDKCFIFRIPRVITDDGNPKDFRQHIKRWTLCEDITRSIIYPETLVKAVTRALADPDIPRGVYNLASEAVHLPTFIKENYGWEGEIVAPYSLGYYTEGVLDTGKAESVGLI